MFLADYLVKILRAVPAGEYYVGHIYLKKRSLVDLFIGSLVNTQQQMNHELMNIFAVVWWTGAELNRRPRRCERRVLPTELPAHNKFKNLQ